MNRPWTMNDKTAYVSLPEGNGPGIEIDRAKLVRVAADPKYKWRWPGSKMRDGSIADY